MVVVVGNHPGLVYNLVQVSVHTLLQVLAYNLLRVQDDNLLQVQVDNQLQALEAVVQGDIDPLQVGMYQVQGDIQGRVEDQALVDRDLEDLLLLDDSLDRGQELLQGDIRRLVQVILLGDIRQLGHRLQDGSHFHGHLGGNWSRTRGDDQYNTLKIYYLFHYVKLHNPLYLFSYTIIRFFYLVC